jgi:hypothetical protein
VFSSGSGSKLASFGNFAAGGSAALTRLALRHWRGRVYCCATWESGVLSTTSITTRVGEIREVGGLVRWKERKYWSEIAVIPFQRADLILCRGEGPCRLKNWHAKRGDTTLHSASANALHPASRWQASRYASTAPCARCPGETVSPSPAGLIRGCFGDRMSRLARGGGQPRRRQCEGGDSSHSAQSELAASALARLRTCSRSSRTPPGKT